jgi:hypothetical protein
MRFDSQHPLHVLEAQGSGAGRGMSVAGAGVVISAVASARNVFDEHGDGARGLLQGLVDVVGVHHGEGAGVLVTGDELSVVAVHSHLQHELRVVPLRVRGDHRGDAASLDRRWSGGIVLVRAGGPSCAAVAGSGVRGLRPRVRQQHHPLPGSW